MTRSVFTFVGLLSLLLLPQNANANLLTNGDFESPDEGSSGFVFNVPAGSTLITGWTVTQGNVDLTTTGCCFTAFSGKQDVDLVGANAGNGGLTQTFATSIGQTYDLTLYYSRNYFASVSPGGAQITTASASVSVLDDSSISLLLATITDGNPIPAGGGATPEWNLFSGQFTADSVLTTLTINNTVGGYNGGIYLDDVSVDPVNAGTTPLPATLPLFAGGLGALGLLGWRRKRKAQAVA